MSSNRDEDEDEDEDDQNTETEETETQTARRVRRPAFFDSVDWSSVHRGTHE